MLCFKQQQKKVVENTCKIGLVWLQTAQSVAKSVPHVKVAVICPPQNVLKASKVGCYLSSDVVAFFWLDMLFQDVMIGGHRPSAVVSRQVTDAPGDAGGGRAGQ